MMEFEAEIFSVGHSRLSYEKFVNLLMTIGINMIVDVRSAPYSRSFPHFNRENLQRELELDGIFYSFLGRELGGRPQGSKFFCDGIADYEKMSQASFFKAGIDQVLNHKNDYRIALMCSEHNPLDCHRCLLVGRALANKKIAVGHVYPDGSIKSQNEIEQQLLRMSEKNQADIFISSEERLAQAYRIRSKKVAYSLPEAVCRSKMEMHGE